MVWIFCAIIAVIMIALGVRSYFNKKSGSLRIVFVLACLFVATYVVYIPVFLASYDWLSAVVGNFANVLRVISLDADVMDAYDVMYRVIDNAVFARIYMFLLAILHTALPAMSALTAVAVLFRCFSSMQLFLANCRKKPVFVFSEMNERSLKLAKSLENIRCDILFTNSTEDALNNEADSKQGFILSEEGIAEINIKSRKGKDVYFFCISDDEEAALSQALQLIERHSQSRETAQKHIHIFLFSKHRDFAVFVDSADKGHLDVQCVNEYEMLIYNLLNRYPLFRYARKDIHVLLHGLSPINLTALRAIAWCGQISGYSMKISVVGADIGKQVDDVRLNFPGLFTERYDIRFYDCGSENEVVETIRTHCADANYIIVSEETDNSTMSSGILLRRLFYKLSKNYDNCPPIFCYVKEPSKFHIVQKLATAESNPKRKMSYDLTPFGSLDEVYSYKMLVDSDLEKIAKNVHLAYEEIFSDGAIDVDEALARYSIFEVNKRSNRANALHIRYKLNLLGLDYTDRTDVQTVSLEEYYTDESMRRLAYSEHDRWMAFLETEGWETASKEDVYAYRESGVSKGRHNCPLLKMHPYICAYEALEALSMDLEGKDTTVYDSELILRIPDILGDKWHVAGKTFQIIKLD